MARHGDVALGAVDFSERAVVQSELLPSDTTRLGDLKRHSSLPPRFATTERGPVEALGVISDRGMRITQALGRQGNSV